MSRAKKKEDRLRQQWLERERAERAWRRERAAAEKVAQERFVANSTAQWVEVNEIVWMRDARTGFLYATAYPVFNKHPPLTGQRLLDLDPAREVAQPRALARVIELEG